VGQADLLAPRQDQSQQLTRGEGCLNRWSGSVGGRKSRSLICLPHASSQSSPESTPTPTPTPTPHRRSRDKPLHLSTHILRTETSHKLHLDLHCTSQRTRLYVAIIRSTYVLFGVLRSRIPSSCAVSIYLHACSPSILPALNPLLSRWF
jgi:hypothetical protein